MSVADRPYLSIGEVLGLLLEEFPDVTISKIRFLESQGLIDPERTPSGYRKFYDVDVERLRVILREQRENFLPLKVIRHRLENGQIDDPSGAFTPPRGVRNVPTDEPIAGSGYAVGEIVPTLPTAQPEAGDVAGADAGDVTGDVGAPDESPTADGTRPDPEPAPAADPTPVAQMAPLEAPARDTYTAAELCAAAGLTAAQLDELTSFGLLAQRPAGGVYQHSDLDIARATAGLLRHGLEGRHLRAWRQSADREAGLFEQVVLPFLRQRNPASRQQAVRSLEELAQLGGELRAALLHAALQHHLNS